MEYSLLTRKERLMQLQTLLFKLSNIVKKLMLFLCWKPNPGNESMFWEISLSVISLVAVVVSMFGGVRSYQFLILGIVALLLQHLPRIISAKTNQCIQLWLTT